MVIKRLMAIAAVAALVAGLVGSAEAAQTLSAEIKGKELNELARMSAICDIFGALTDERSYKPAFPAEKAFAILESMDKGIDQGMLKVFRNIFDSTAVEAA